MATSIASRLLLTLSMSFVSLVIAGHAVWESGSTTVTADWIHIEPDAQYVPWPKSTIPYCYNNAQTREKMAGYMRQGMALWYANGLPEGFKMIEKPTEWCIRNRAESLVVYYKVQEGAGSYFSSIARSGHDTNFDGPHLYIGPGVTEYAPPELIVWAVAHELGHVWGLLHEHQDPLLWQSKDPANGEHRALIIFYCENVQGYDELLKKYGGDKDILFEHDGPCRVSERAEKDDFNGAAILPFSTTRHQSPRPMWPTDEDVDWKSIMIYESDLLGKLDENKNHMTVWLRTKGKKFVLPPLVPTNSDIEGLLHMYRTRFTTLRQPLHNEPQSPWYQLFKQKVKCSWW
jgi:hypothetical protein